MVKFRCQDRYCPSKGKLQTSIRLEYSGTRILSLETGEAGPFENLESYSKFGVCIQCGTVIKPGTVGRIIYQIRKEKMEKIDKQELSIVNTEIRHHTTKP